MRGPATKPAARDAVCYFRLAKEAVKSKRGIGILPMINGLEARATTRSTITSESVTSLPNEN